ncbi:hypothetical protein GLYMA_14G075350v4 [Glycine max]|nr:hypothetical protein GLYMA_14G075350v4 [Glycine max]KAH1093521.1 hypothetical protein GYH30_039311 [Glycine max]
MPPSSTWQTAQVLVLVSGTAMARFSWRKIQHVCYSTNLQEKQIQQVGTVNNKINGIAINAKTASWKAIVMFLNICLTEVSFESDCKILINRFCSNTTDMYEAGALLMQCRQLLLSNQIFHLDKPMLWAHSLARVATSYSCL